jgi:hypothetical protein
MGKSRNTYVFCYSPCIKHQEHLFDRRYFERDSALYNRQWEGFKFAKLRCRRLAGSMHKMKMNNAYG